MAQYCYYNSNTLIRKVNFNGATYRKVNLNGTPFTISTWYSATCINAPRDYYTISSRYKTISEDAYVHTLSITRYDGATYTQTMTLGLDDGENVGAVSTNQGYGNAGYMSVSWYYTGTWGRETYKMTPPDRTSAYKYTYRSVSEYVASENRNVYEVNFSYSTSSISAANAFIPENYTQYYDASQLDFRHEYNTYTVVGVCAWHKVYPRIQTVTF